MSDRRRISEQIREGYNVQRERRQKMQKIQRLSLMVVGALFVVLVIGYFVFAGQRGNTPAEVYDRYFALPSLEVPSGDSEDLSKAVASMDAGQYQEALRQLGDYQQTHPDTDIAMLYEGALLLQLDKPEMGLSTLRNVSVLAPERPLTEWYIGLGLLKIGQTSMAYAVFEEIAATPDHPRRAQAQRAAVEVKNLLN